jgi:hypothetical protein
MGRPSEENTYVLFWENQDLEVSAAKSSECALTSIEFRVKVGREAVTDDGVVLGKTTVAEGQRILQPRMGAESESVEAPEGNWEALIVLTPRPGFSYKGTYRAFLSERQAGLLSHDPVFDDFRLLPVMGYGVEMVASTDVPRN